MQESYSISRKVKHDNFQRLENSEQLNWSESYSKQPHPTIIDLHALTSLSYLQYFCSIMLKRLHEIIQIANPIFLLNVNINKQIKEIIYNAKDEIPIA